MQELSKTYKVTTLLFIGQKQLMLKLSYFFHNSRKELSYFMHLFLRQVLLFIFELFRNESNGIKWESKPGPLNQRSIALSTSPIPWSLYSNFPIKCIYHQIANKTCRNILCNAVSKRSDWLKSQNLHRCFV